MDVVATCVCPVTSVSGHLWSVRVGRSVRPCSSLLGGSAQPLAPGQCPFSDHQPEESRHGEHRRPGPTLVSLCRQVGLISLAFHIMGITGCTQGTYFSSYCTRDTFCVALNVKRILFLVCQSSWNLESSYLK